MGDGLGSGEGDFRFLLGRPQVDVIEDTWGGSKSVQNRGSCGSGVRAPSHCVLTGKVETDIALGCRFAVENETAKDRRREKLDSRKYSNKNQTYEGFFGSFWTWIQSWHLEFGCQKTKTSATFARPPSPCTIGPQPPHRTLLQRLCKTGTASLGNAGNLGLFFPTMIG